MGYYKNPPVLDETEQAEFDKYLKEQYRKDLEMAISILDVDYNYPNILRETDEESRFPLITSVFDKLATPRIYLLQAWLHKRSQEAAGMIEAEGPDK